MPNDEYAAETEIDIEPAIEQLDVESRAPLEWDKKARNLMRQILHQKVDLPISRLVLMIDEKEVDLSPDFQRRLRWTRAQQSRFIESIIMNVPIPPVFLGEDVPGRYVVLDGRQRLTALYEYLTDKFALSGLEVWPELNGKKNKQLPSVDDTPIATAITRRFIPAVIVLHESVPEIKYEVFDRLNTGGVIAEPMEVRNAIYRGEFTKLLHEVTNTAEFCTLWGIPVDKSARLRNGTYRRMVDLEMALRFFAFQDYKRFAGSLKNFLTAHMERRNKEYLADSSLKQADSNLFLNTMQLALQLLGDDALHRSVASNEKSLVPSAPYADAVLYAISQLLNKGNLMNLRLRIRQEFERLCLDDNDFTTAITVGTNARTAAEYRIEAATSAVLNVYAEFQAE